MKIKIRYYLGKDKGFVYNEAFSAESLARTLDNKRLFHSPLLKVVDVDVENDTVILAGRVTEEENYDTYGPEIIEVPEGTSKKKFYSTNNKKEEKNSMVSAKEVRTIRAEAHQQKMMAAIQKAYEFANTWLSERFTKLAEKDEDSCIILYAPNENIDYGNLYKVMESSIGHQVTETVIHFPTLLEYLEQNGYQIERTSYTNGWTRFIIEA